MIANFHAWLPLFDLLPGGRREERHGVETWRSDTPLPLFNGLWGAPRTADVEAAVDELIDGFGETPLVWIVPPPDDVDAVLERRGLLVERLPGMAVDLAAVPGPRPPAGVEVREVDDDPELLEAATRVSFTASGFPAWATEPMLAMLARLPHRDAYRTFLVTVGGEPAAASVLLETGKVAGLFNVGTLPGHRGRGLGTLVSVAALAAGRARGCELGALQATADGEPIYRALGFEECCRITFASRF